MKLHICFTFPNENLERLLTKCSGRSQQTKTNNDFVWKITERKQHNKNFVLSNSIVCYLKAPICKKNRFQTQFEKNLTGSLANEFKRTNLESILTYRVKRKLKHQLLA